MWNVTKSECLNEVSKFAYVHVNIWVYLFLTLPLFMYITLFLQFLLWNTCRQKNLLKIKASNRRISWISYIEKWGNNLMTIIWHQKVLNPFPYRKSERKKKRKMKTNRKPPTQIIHLNSGKKPHHNEILLSKYVH